MKIKVNTYKHDQGPNGYAGWVEPEDGSWLLFIGNDGRAELMTRAEDGKYRAA